VSLRPELSLLLDAARSEVKRYGGTLNLLHLSAAVARRWPQEHAAVFSEERTGRITAGLNQKVAVGDEDAVERLLERSNGPDPISQLVQELAASLDPWLQEASPEGPPPTGDTVAREPSEDEDDGAFALPQRTKQFLEVVVPDPEIRGREGVLDDLLALIGRRQAEVPLLVGDSGSGRTTVLQALAARLAAPSHRGPLAGMPVVRVVPEALIGADTANALRRIFEDVDGDVVLAIEDLDVIATFGGQGANLDVLNVIRSGLGRTGGRVVLTMDRRYSSRLQVANQELADEVQIIDLPPLSRPIVEAIAASTAAELSEFHSVELPTEVVAAATAEPQLGAPRVHPGLVVDRLDGACARATARAGAQVSLGDLGLADATRNFLTDPVALADRLAFRVVGQSDAISRVARRVALTRARLDLRPDRPDGVFLFVGPTGVGKTELARSLCAEVFGDERRLIRLDMSEYAHDWALSRLIGPQPGFVGFTEPESWLTTRIAKEPHTVLLLDEVEKAHPTIWNAFLQVFDAGRLSDARGTVADFSSVIVAMTSNLGAEKIGKPALGFRSGDSDGTDDRVWETIRATMAPELVNRIDEIVVFRPLDPDVIRAIAAREIEQVVERLRGLGYQLTVGQDVIDALATTGYDPAFGARHLQRNVERMLLQPLVQHEARVLTATLEGGEVVWRPSPT
jgi:ATP-dependent Clp protease ATP-binding subunit ClpA